MCSPARGAKGGYDERHVPTLFHRIASLSASTSAIAAGCGAADRLVAVTRDCARLTPELAGLPLVGDAWSAKSADVLAHAPELVIASAPYDAETVGRLVKDRARFVATSPWTLADIYTDIRMLGSLLERPHLADALVADMQSAIEATRARTLGHPRPRVYCEVWMKPIMSSPVWVSELVEAAGGEPVVAGGRVLDPEAVLAANPEVVVMAWCGAIGRSRPEKLLARPGFDGLAAARSGRVVPVRDEFLNAPCQHLVTGLRILAHCIHPEVFGELPEELRAPVRAAEGGSTG